MFKRGFSLKGVPIPKPGGTRVAMTRQQLQLFLLSPRLNERASNRPKTTREWFKAGQVVVALLSQYEVQ